MHKAAREASYQAGTAADLPALTKLMGRLPNVKNLLCIHHITIMQPTTCLLPRVWETY